RARCANFGIDKDTSKSMILVPLLNPKFATVLAANAGELGFAALAACPCVLPLRRRTRCVLPHRHARQDGALTLRLRGRWESFTPALRLNKKFTPRANNDKKRGGGAAGAEGKSASERRRSHFRRLRRDDFGR